MAIVGDADALAAVRSATHLLAELVPHAQGFGPKIAANLKETVADAEKRLAQTGLTLALVGEAAPRRVLLLTIAGEELVSINAKPRAAKRFCDGRRASITSRSTRAVAWCNFLSRCPIARRCSTNR